MTDKEILEKAIEQAKGGGFQFKYLRTILCK